MKTLRLTSQSVFRHACFRRPEGLGGMGGGGGSARKPLHPQLVMMLTNYSHIIFRRSPFCEPVTDFSRVPLDAREKQEIMAIVQNGFHQQITLTEMYRQLLTNERYAFIRRHLVPFIFDHAQKGLLEEETEAISNLANAVCQPRSLDALEPNEYYNKLMNTFESRPGIDPGIFRAMRANPRKYFMPAFYSDLDTATDMAMPIGYFQTVSQPSLVAAILNISGVGQGMRVLEIGYGSGWLLSLLANIVGQEGRVYGSELVPQLAVWGKENVLKLGHENVNFLEIDEHNLPIQSPDNLDAIIFSAEVPNNDHGKKFLGHVSRYLSPTGIMIFPMNHSLYLGRLQNDNLACGVLFQGTSFVPLILKP